MKIVAPKDLQRLNCGFIGWQLQTTELLVKNRVSTSITVHLLVSLLVPSNHLCHPFYQPVDLRSPCQVDEPLLTNLLVNLLVHSLINLLFPLNDSH